MWTWSITATGLKKDVIDAVKAQRPPKLDGASVDIEENGKIKQRKCVELNGFDEFPEERERLKAERRAARRAARKEGDPEVEDDPSEESDEKLLPKYKSNEIDLPTSHRDKFQEAKDEVLKKLKKFPDDALCSVSVSGNDTEYNMQVHMVGTAKEN